MAERPDSAENQPPVRPVDLAHASTSGQFQAGLPPTVQVGSGMTPRCRQMSTVGRLTPSRSATSAMPTGSQSSMSATVEKVLTEGKGCVDNHYMTNLKYEVVTIGHNHYVTHSISREFVGVAFTSKAKAQAKADEKNEGR